MLGIGDTVVCPRAKEAEFHPHPPSGQILVLGNRVMHIHGAWVSLWGAWTQTTTDVRLVFGIDLRCANIFASIADVHRLD